MKSGSEWQRSSREEWSCHTTTIEMKSGSDWRRPSDCARFTAMVMSIGDEEIGKMEDEHRRDGGTDEHRREEDGYRRRGRRVIGEGSGY
jgi:hypothetical protein